MLARRKMEQFVIVKDVENDLSKEILLVMEILFCIIHGGMRNEELYDNGKESRLV